MPTASAKIVRFHQVGGPEVLKMDELPLTEPGPGEVRLRIKAIGLNRAEVMFRQGHYLVQPVLPAKLGYEASGCRSCRPGRRQEMAGENSQHRPHLCGR